MKVKTAIIIVICIVLTGMMYGCVEESGTTGERTILGELDALVLPLSDFGSGYKKEDEQHLTDGHANDLGYWVTESYGITYKELGTYGNYVTQGLVKYNSSNDAEESLKAAIERLEDEHAIELLSTDKIGDDKTVLVKISQSMQWAEYTVYAVEFKVANVVATFAMAGTTMLKPTVIDHARDLADNIESAVVTE